MRKPKLGRRRVARKHWQRKERREKKAERARETRESKRVMYALGRIGDPEDFYPIDEPRWFPPSSDKLDLYFKPQYIDFSVKANRVPFHHLKGITV